MLSRRSLLLAPAARGRFVGVTMMPEYIQNEGVDGVLENLVKRARVTAVATSPYVMEPSTEKDGSREPPIDAGAGSVRLLDRPLWGKRELFVRTAPSYIHDFTLFQGLSYQPQQPNDLTRREGGKVGEFVRQARGSGLRVYFQIQAAIPPAYRVQFGGPRDEDKPRLPDGSTLSRRVSNNGSLASPAIRGYLTAILKDLIRAYPEIQGVRLDWPEYPPYFYDELFLDFAAPGAAALRSKVEPLWKGKEFISSLPDLERLKAGLVVQLMREARAALGPGRELIPNAFPPPFHRASGMHYEKVAPLVDGLSVKLYTMHWPMMLKFWSEGRDAAFFSKAQQWMRIADPGHYQSPADCRYPEPDEPHAATEAAMAAKIRQARREAGRTPVYALAHGYGPAADFRRRLRVAWQSSGGRVWINRYGYLSNEKLDIIREVCV